MVWVEIPHGPPDRVGSPLTSRGIDPSTATARRRSPRHVPRRGLWHVTTLVAMSSPLISRMQPFGTTIFAEMSALATRTGAINLGQGFPDTDGPREIDRKSTRLNSS